MPKTYLRQPNSFLPVLLASCAGNTLEWYDFTVFGYFAPQIAAAFFPASDQATGLLLTFGTYGVSFLARPFGAMVLGGYADRAGRRAALLASILLMMLGTAMMVIMPGYATIGRLAPLGILAARLIQGFSAGGEFGGATVFMLEHTGRRPGFFGSFQFTTQALAAMLGAGAGWVLSAALGPAQMSAWGFRLPFALGLLIGPVGLYVRGHMDETPAFRASAPPTAPVRTLLAQHGGQVLLAAFAVAAGTAGTYLNVYLPTFAQKHLHIGSSAAFAITFTASCVPFVVTPLSGFLSDRPGWRPRIMLVSLGLMAAGCYPGFLLIQAYPTPICLGAVAVGLSMLRAAYSAPLPGLYAAMFPVSVRAAGMSLGYTIGIVLFGGFAQLEMEKLIQVTGNASVPGMYVGCASVLSFMAVWRLWRFGH